MAKSKSSSSTASVVDMKDKENGGSGGNSLPSEISIIATEGSIDRQSPTFSPISIQVPDNIYYGVDIAVLEGSKYAKGSKPPTTNGILRQKSNSSSSGADRKKRLTMPLAYRLYESQSEDVSGTVVGPEDEDFRPEEASKQLRQALAAGLQADDRLVIRLILSHNNYQRQKIAAAYEGMYNRILANDLEEEMGGYFLEAVLALIQPAQDYSAKQIHYAIALRSHSHSTAVEIGLTSTASQLKVIRDAYQAKYRVSLERDLNQKIEGLFGKMLSMLLLRSKDVDAEVDVVQAEQDVEYLAASGGVEELGRNIDVFNRLFGTANLNQIRAFLERYDSHVSQPATAAIGGGGGGHLGALNQPHTEFRRDFEASVRKNVNMHSDIRQMLLLFVRISRNMQLYFAEKLHEAISGARPDHAAVVRILVARSEIDLHDICGEYRSKYSRHIMMDLQSTFSGEFLRLLTQLVIASHETIDDIFG